MGADLATGPQRFKRRIIVIKRTLQLKYIGVVLLAMVLAAFTVGFEMYYAVGRTMLDTVKDPNVIAVYDRVNSLLPGKLLVLVVIMVVIALFVSHKFAGPIFRFEKSTQEVSTGDLTHRIRLRAGDELMELQTSFNAMLDNLQQGVVSDRHLAEEINDRLTVIAARLNRGALSAQDAQQLAREISELRDKTSRITSSFKI